MTQRISPLIVEFLGIPGSGKTTVAKAVISQLNQKGITSNSIEEIRAYERILEHKNKIHKLWVSRRLLLYLSIVWKVLYFVFCHFPKEMYKVKIQTVLGGFLVFKHQVAKYTDAGYNIVVLDEAVLHRIYPVTGQGRELPDKASRNLLFKITNEYKQLFILHDVKLEDSLQRIRTREILNRRKEPMNVSHLLKLSSEQIPKLLVDIPEERLLVVDGSRSVEEKAEMIVKFLLKHYENRGIIVD